MDIEAETVMIRDRKHPRSEIGNDQTVPLLDGPVVIDDDLIEVIEIVFGRLKNRRCVATR